MRRPARRRHRVPAALVVALLALSGCTSSPAQEPGAPAPAATAAPAAGGSYVALGDSYTAAPFVPVTDLAQGCLRSDGNYPALVAAALDDVPLTDVSCSGATTADVTQPQRTAQGRGRVPPQLRAVTAETALVTVGLGGNDERLFASLLSCVATGAGSGAPAGAFDEASCLTARAEDPAAVVRRTGTRVARVLAAVREQAPEAAVVLVGYPRLVGQAGGCARFPVAGQDVAAARRVERLLDEALEAAARAEDAAYVDVYALSRGHEICSDDPWVNGRRTDESRAAAYHPFAEEQQAVADAIVDLVGPREETTTS